MKSKFTIGLFGDNNTSSPSDTLATHQQLRLNALKTNLAFLPDDAVTKKQKELADSRVLLEEKIQQAKNELNKLHSEFYANLNKEKELTGPLRQSDEAKEDLNQIRKILLINIQGLVLAGNKSMEFCCPDRFESRKEYLEFFSQILENYGVKFYQTSEWCKVDDEQFNVYYWNIKLPEHFCNTTLPVQESDIQCSEWLNKWLISFDKQISLIFKNAETKTEKLLTNQSIKDEDSSSFHLRSRL